MIAGSASLMAAWLAQDPSPNIVPAFAGEGRSAILRFLWLIPAIPMFAAGLIALLKQPQRKIAAGLAIGSLGCSLLLAIGAFGHVLSAWEQRASTREVVSFNWLDLGATHLQL